MKETRTFQICYEGDLTPALDEAIRGFGGEVNSENGWQLRVDGETDSMRILRSLREHIAADGHLLVARTQAATTRDFLLITHGVTDGIDYEPLHRAIGGFGYAMDLPFSGTYVVQTLDRRDVGRIGRELARFCPDDDLLVVGISHDLAVCDAITSRMVIPHGLALRTRMQLM